MLGLGFGTMLRDLEKVSFSKKRIADCIRFDTEAHALKHAAALAALQPGSAVLVKAEGEEVRRGIYMGRSERGSAHVMACDAEMCLITLNIPMGAIRFLA